MPTYKLTYFNGKGRAEVARLLFIKNGVEFEDKRIKLFTDEFDEFKAKTSEYKMIYKTIQVCDWFVHYEGRMYMLLLFFDNYRFSNLYGFL